MYIDTHAHLFREGFNNELEEVIQRALDAGVDRIVVPGTNVRSSREAVELAERFDFIFASVGIHPHEALNFDDSHLKEIEVLADHPKVVAIGEIGLDYHYNFSPHDRQMEVLREQIMLAAQKDLPIVVHTRESLEDTMTVIDRCIQERPHWMEGKRSARGVFHCFTGTANEAGRLIEKRFYVSYPGIVTFKNSPVLETLRNIGCENILLETDSPYMAPVPFRGKRNEPAHIVHIARKISEILGISEIELARITTLSAKKLFKFDS